MRAFARTLGAIAAVSVLVGSFSLSQQAHAAGEAPSDYVVRDVIPTHFYQIGVRHVAADFGTPYVTAVSGNNLASIDWGFEVGSIDAATGESKLLGTLPMPTGTRILDFVSIPEVKAPNGFNTIMLSYAVKVGTCRKSILRESRIDLSGSKAPELGRIWFTSPCYPATTADSVPNELSQAGGRVVAVPDSWRVNAKKPEFFFSIGDFAVAKPKSVVISKAARAMNASIVRVSAPQRSQVWATGLRNVQGLVIATIDGEKQLISTEHGPRGGDEMNVIVQGADYGWPRTSYGTPYSADQPQNTADVQGKHVGKSSLPLFAWVPSAGVGPIIQIKGKAFGTWWANTPGSADLFVAGMGARFIYRFRVQDGAVRYMEEAQFGARIRSMVQLPSGAIACGLDAGNDLLILQPTASWSESASSFQGPN